MVQENYTNPISFYTKGKLSNPSKSVDRFAVYESIKTDYRAETQFIQNKYGVSIAAKFPDGKTDYQADKKAVLNGVCFSGNIDRSSITSFKHNGIINLDIDENSKDELEQFFLKVPTIKFCEAAARSVSSPQTGAFWLNAKIEIPINWNCISIKLRKLLGLQREEKKELSYTDIEVIHKAYHEALKHLFLKHGINVGNAKDVKRMRYLSHDSSIYVNDKAETYTLKALELILATINKTDENQGFNRVAATINKSDAFEYAHEFADKSTGEYGAGNKHNYLVHFSIACNRLGVEQDKAAAYIESTYPDKQSGNYLSFPYKKYKESFGAWKGRIYKKGNNIFKQFTLKKGEYLGDIWISILDTYLNEWTNEHKVLLDWKAGTGTGKSTVVAENLAPALKEFTGLRTIIVYPLNSLTEKQAIKYGKHFLTGEVLDPEQQQAALQQNIIFCNQNTFPRLVDFFESTGEQFHLFFDESHDLPNGTNYKFDVVSELWHKKDRIAASITLLSGTPTEYFSELGFKRIEFIQEYRPTIKMICKEMVQAPDLTALQHCLNSDSNKQVLLQLQSKKSIDNITQLLGVDYSKDGEVLKFYSEKHIKQQSYYDDLVKASSIDNSFRDARFIFCTSFINTGVDVYQNDKELEGVYINKEFNHPLNDWLQFGDRWRTDNDKTVYYYYKADKLPQKIENLTKEIDSLVDNETDEAKKLINELERLQALKKFQEKEYNSKYEFQKLLKEYRYRAKWYNKRFNKFAGDITMTDAYKSEISESNAFILDNDGVHVNEMYLMKLVHHKAQKNITYKRFLDRIRKNFKYIDIVEDKQANEAPEDAEKGLTKLKRIEKGNKNKAQNKIYHFLTGSEKQVFLQAVRIKTDDSKFKRIVRPNKVLNDAAFQLISDNRILFDRYLCYAVTAWKRVKELEQLHLAEIEALEIVFNIKKSGLTTMASNRGYSSFIKKYKIQLILFLYTLEIQTGQKLLTNFQRNDVKRYQSFRDAISHKAQESGISAKDILFTALGIWNKRGARITTGITQNISVTIFKSLYCSKYSNHLYNIDAEQPLLKLDNILNNYNIDAFNVKKRIEKIAQKKESILL